MRTVIASLFLVGLTACLGSVEGNGDPAGGGMEGKEDDPGGAAPDGGVEPAAGCTLAVTYPGDLHAPRYFEGNQGAEVDRYRAFHASLEQRTRPDRLVMAAFFDAGELATLTGTFTLPSEVWDVSICTDYQPVAPTCAALALVTSGELVIERAGARLTGILTEAIFLTEEDGTCATLIEAARFDEPLANPAI